MYSVFGKTENISSDLVSEKFCHMNLRGIEVMIEFEFNL